MKSYQTINVAAKPNTNIDGSELEPTHWQTEVIRLPAQSTLGGFVLPAGVRCNVAIRGGYAADDNDGQLFEVFAGGRWLRFENAEQMVVLDQADMVSIQFVRLVFDANPGPSIKVCFLT
jgi:hypothetical protein